MITQMYFPGDPLFALDPIYQSITDQKARDRLVATYDHDVTTHEWATGYRWDIVLTGAHRTPIENPTRRRPLMTTLLTATPGPDRRPVLRLRAAVRPRQRTGAARLARRDPVARRRHRRRRATRFPMRCWRSGRPTPTARPAADRLPAPRRLDVHRLGPRRTDDDGHYSFSTVLPGATEPGAAPFIMVTVFARGLLNRLFTRAYLPGERPGGRPAAGLASRRAARHPDRHARRATGLRFDIQLQGASDETVFLQLPGASTVTDLFWPGDHLAGD